MLAPPQVATPSYPLQDGLAKTLAAGFHLNGTCQGSVSVEIVPAYLSSGTCLGLNFFFWEETVPANLLRA